MKASLTLQTIACLLVSLVQAAQLTISIPSSHILENPSALPPSTHATLLGPNGQLRRALLTRSNTLSFPSLPVGAHLLNIHSRDYIFAPLRVDVLPSTTAEGTAEIIEVHQTFRGNEWSNKGQKYGSAKDKLVIAIPPTGKRDFYMSRGGFDLMSFFKNPMILIGIASMGLVFGMPYLMDNMDEETKAEFEEMSKKSPMAAQGPANAMQNFDLAGFLAGSSKQSGASSGQSSSAAKAKK